MTRYEDPEGTGESSSSRQGRGPSDPGAPPGRAGRRAAQMGERPTGIRRILGRHPVLSILGILATLTITFVSLSAYAAYRGVYDSIHHVTITKGELGKRPPKLNGSENILIIGSDSRAGIHGYGRGIRGSRSDTSMLLHIPPTHSGATVISFPRDTMVPIYQCEADGQGHHGQQAQPGGLEQLNSTFSFGGAPCLWKTLEQVTHIHIDHFVEVNFAGFQSIVNDVGGVPVCLPYAIRDPASKLNLPAGRSVVRGAQALAFVRERHIGYGSDLQRINRQQVFLASLAQKIKQSSSLTNPAKLYTLVHDIASSLTTDTGLSFNDMYAIANSLKGLSTSALQFVMAPVAPYPANPNDLVEFNQPSADQLFRAIARDNHILKTARRADHAKPQPLPTVQPEPGAAPGAQRDERRRPGLDHSERTDRARVQGREDRQRDWHYQQHRHRIHVGRADAPGEHAPQGNPQCPAQAGDRPQRQHHQPGSRLWLQGRQHAQGTQERTEGRPRRRRR